MQIESGVSGWVRTIESTPLVSIALIKNARTDLVGMRGYIRTKNSQATQEIRGRVLGRSLILELERERGE